MPSKELFDLDAEEAVLGSCLIDDLAISKVQFLSPEHFYRDKNQWVFLAIQSLAKRNEKINQTTIAHEILRCGKLEAIGGSAYLSNLIMNTPTSVHVEYYSRIVLRLAGYRSLKMASASINTLAQQDNPVLAETLSQAETELSLLRSEFCLDDEHVMYHDQAMEAYLKMQSDLSLRPWLETPWQKYNEMVRLRSGTVTTIAGPSSMGKTAFVEQVLEYAAQVLGANGLYIFLELEPSQLLNRRACRWIELQNGDAPRMTDLEDGRYKDSPEMADFVKYCQSWPGKITMVSAVGWSIHRICAEIRQKAAQGLADFVVVDYLQLIPREDVTRRNVTDPRAMGLIVQHLKQTCQSLPKKPPLITVSQVNRQLKQLEDCTLATLRESGEIGEYSNVVTFVFSQWDASKPKGACVATCTKDRATQKVGECYLRCMWFVTAKNTFGPQGEVMVRHIPPRYKFVDTDRYGQQTDLLL